MDLLSAILGVPIFQALGLIFVIGLAERMCIPLVSLFKSLFKMNGNGHNPKELHELKDMMSGLTGHFNDTTTNLLSEIRDNTHATVTKLNELEKYGFPQRDCPKE